MIALIQRVQTASVLVGAEEISRINRGLLAFIGIDKSDNSNSAQKLAERLLAYRIFNDDNQKMNWNVTEISGEILLVSQFTLVADTNKGNRPSFSSAMLPAAAQKLFTHLCQYLQSRYSPVVWGKFGAHMTVKIVNDGPVTFWLKS